MEFTWLPDTLQSRRRTRAMRACATCQRKKKRCRHVSIENKPSSFQTQDYQVVRHVSQDAPVLPSHLSISHSIPERKSTSPSLDSPQIERFVGDLNPEAVIREKLSTTDESQLRDKIGLWINSQDRKGNREEDGPNQPATYPGYLPHHSLKSHDIASVLQQRYSAAMNACERLPLSTLEHLIPLYFSKVNHILPLVDQESFPLPQSQGIPSVFLERAICLVAAKDRTASPYLRLVPDGPLLTPRHFCSDVYNGLVTAMNNGLEPDRTTRIRILALMSLHPEGYDGAEAASMHICQAIHQAQTAGLHLERPGRVPGDSLTHLFWCLWSLDKMHACIGGRPVLFADRDIGIAKPVVEASPSKSAFDVWLAISDLLATVISFYRPFADHTTGWEEDFPTFEDIIGDHVGQDLDFATLGVLEVYYHAVSILSRRCKLSDRLDGSKPSYIRQGLSAIRIYSLVATECSGRLPPLPLVPYGVSLSMGVAYQQFRSSRLITHSDRARASLEACCTLLEDLGIFWPSAEAMARLGRKTLHHIKGATNLDDHRPGHASLPTMAANIAPAPASSRVSLVGMPPSNEEGNELFGSDPMAAAVPGEGLSGTAEEIQDPNESDTFANIDNLFGEFLDLSLPTNFWDPVFLSPEKV